MIAASACLVLMVACSSSGGGGASSSSAGGVLKIGSNSVVDSMNPFVAIEQDSGTLFEYMYPFLIDYDSKTLEPNPDFATKWEESANGLTWTFHTVSGARWSDGQPLTAKDMAWTIDTILKFAHGPAANLAGSVKHMKSVEAPDDNTLVVTYQRPIANALPNLSGIPILPQHVWSQYAAGDGKGLRTYPNTPVDHQPVVSGGPFLLVEFQSNQDVILKTNPNFYGPAPHIKGFALQYFTNNDAEIQALKTGTIDAVENVPVTTVKTLRSDASINVFNGPGIGFKDLIINSSPKKTTNLELQDPRVREAMEYAIDRNAIVNTAWLGYAEPGSSIVTPSTPEWNDPTVKGLAFNISAANQILDNAGYRRGSDGIRMANGHPMSYQILFAADEIGEGETAFRIIQNGFRQIGIDVQEREMDDSAINNAIIGQDAQYQSFDLAMWDWTATGFDPDFILSVLTRAQWGGWSDSGYDNPTYDELYGEQGLATKPAERKQIVDRMQHIIANDRPYIVLNYNDTLNAWSKDWTGFVESPEGWFSALSKESLEQVHQTASP